MANEKDSVVALPVTLMEKQYLQKAVDSLRQQIVRSRAKELPGSDVYKFRTQDIAALDVLRNKLA